MRKLYSFIAFAVMMFVSLTASAWSFDLPSENAVLQNEDYNMRLYKNYNFFGGQMNGEAFTNEAGDVVSGDGCLTLSADKAAFKINGFDAYQVVAPVQMNNFTIQIGTGAVNLRAAVGKTGLHNYGSGSRFVAISDVKAGQIIVCQWGLSSSRASIVQPSNAIAGATACEWEDISEEIHAAQNAGAEEGTNLADGFAYWRATTDGYFVIEIQRDCSIQGLQIWIDASAQEAISAPVMSMASVNGNSRGIDFKPGESTFGSACTSYYITEEDVEAGIEYPIFLKDSDEIDHYDYTYKVDEDGNFILDEDGNKIIDTEIPVYKKVLDKETIEELGQYGEHPYNSDEGLTVDSNADVDGDGYVTIYACTLSEETGAFSSIVELKVNVGEITLNAPTLSLVGIDGVNRNYRIGWSNNTLCGEDFDIKVEGSGADADYYQEYPTREGLGDIISIKEHVTVTISANGYADGVLEYDADVQGIEMKRKNPDATKLHDFDFVNISDEMKAKYTGQIIASYEEYKKIDEETTDTIPHTIAEYELAEAEGIDVSDWAPVPQQFGWYLPIADSRTTLNVIEGGNDQNDNGFGYVEEEIGIFKNLIVSCPPNANNKSCIFKYIDKADGNELGSLGVYFMARPTITFPREVAKLGEYVEIYYGQGGSNYTNSTTHQFYEVGEELLTVTLPSGGVHVFYIDVYTYDDLPVDAIESVGSSSAVAAGYYSISGVKMNSLQKGLNIVKMSDGSVKKIMVK